MKTRRVLITGGNGDIGSAIVNKFRSTDDIVLAPSRKDLDLSSSESLKNYFKENAPDFDVLVHCAGFNNPKPFEELTQEELELSLKVNTLSFIEMAQYLSPYLKQKKEGHILAISSIYGTFSRKKRLAYATSKHGLMGAMKTLALELGPYGIKVNALSPGFVNTKMTSKNNPPEVIQGFVERIPLGRLASIEDIAEISHMLCSSRNQYLHGQNIIVDGGYSIGGFQD